MYKKILFIFICFFCLSLNVFAEEGYYQIGVSDILMSNSGTIIHTNNISGLINQYRISPDTTSSFHSYVYIDLLNDQQNNVPNLNDYFYYDYVNRSTWKGGPTHPEQGLFMKLFVGSGYCAGCSYEDMNLDITNAQLQYIHIRACVSDPSNLTITSVSNIDRFNYLEFVGLYAREYDYIDESISSTFGETCNMIYTDPNTGVAETIPGWQTTIVLKTNGWNARQEVIDTYSLWVETYLSFYNLNPNNYNYIAFYPSVVNRTSHIVTSYDDSRYLAIENANMSDYIRDGVALVDEWYHNFYEVMTDDSNAQFPGFISNWNSMIISNNSITEIMNIPLLLYNKFKSVLNGTCSNYVLPLHIFNSNYNLTLDCNITLASILGNSVTNTINVILSAFILYHFFKFVFVWWNRTTDLRDNLQYYISNDDDLKEGDD